jgi:3-(3-hydroxy-phenyl)propionate hydroxylase
MEGRTMRTEANRNAERQHAVLIAGGGPTGLMLAAELKLAGVDVAVIERRASQSLEGSRAGGLHARTIEVLDQRGVAERFLSQGKTHPAASFNMISLDLSDFPTRHNYLLALFQNHIERILAEWVLDELAAPIYREREVTGLAQDDAAVDVELADGARMRAEYLVGCDGGRSTVRKAAGIDFPGSEATTSWLIAELEPRDEPAWGMRSDAAGLHGFAKLEDGRRARLVLTEAHVASGEPTLRDVSDALVGIYGTDFGVHSPTWVSRFSDMTRQAATYRDRRVLLAGDAAHVHPPVGGQGLNLGVQDAVNLGWKLAQVVKRTSPASLLDTYHAERHPVGARVLRCTMAQVALRRTDERTKALAEYTAELVRMDEPRKRLAGELSGLDIRYDPGDLNDPRDPRDPDARHPLVGRRMPDLELVTTDGPQRVFTLLHEARGVLLNLGNERGRVDIRAWEDRVQLVDASYAGAWTLPVVGAVPAPRAVLFRPAGHVAWVGDRATDDGLDEALAAWFGPPPAAR